MSDLCALVAWDVDDVLNSLTASWAADVGLEDLVDMPEAGDPTGYFAALGWAREDFLSSLDRFRSVNSQTLAASDLAVEAMQQLHRKGLVQVALTKTPLRFGPTSSQWVLANFGHWLSGIVVLPSRRSSDPPHFRYMDKRCVAAMMAVPVVIVDDTPAHLTDLPANCGGVLYPRPWNAADTISDPGELVQRVEAAFDAVVTSGARHP